MVIIYHNPKCSKSRKALELLRESDIEPKIVEYLKEPLNAQELKELCLKLGKLPQEIMRSKETLYKELGLADQNLTEEETLKILAEHPSLLERPIVVKGKKAVVGRPPEEVLALFA